MPQPLIYYIMVPSHDAGRLPRMMQLLQSLRSLRWHNKVLPVNLILAGELSSEENYKLDLVMDMMQVRLVRVGNYACLLDAIWPGASRIFGSSCMLHKLVVLEAGFAGIDADPCFYVDNDTYFHGDPAPLLSQCTQADFYAREEPFSQKSWLGYRPELINDDALMALQTGSRIMPFNTGVTLWNRGLPKRLIPLCRDFVSYCLRYWLWLIAQDRPVDTFPALQRFKEDRQAQASCAGLDPLPYPVGDPWIYDQVALWMTVSQLPGLQQGWFKTDELLQGCEEIRFPERFKRPVLSHYFSANTEAFFGAMNKMVFMAP
ncbi:MAG: hypothetical protein ACAI44_08000 [Candidatus Sericytochromatia bacterium]